MMKSQAVSESIVEAAQQRLSELLPGVAAALGESGASWSDILLVGDWLSSCAEHAGKQTDVAAFNLSIELSWRCGQAYEQFASEVDTNLEDVAVILIPSPVDAGDQTQTDATGSVTPEREIN